MLPIAFITGVKPMVVKNESSFRGIGYTFHREIEQRSVHIRKVVLTVSRIAIDGHHIGMCCL